MPRKSVGSICDRRMSMNSRPCSSATCRMTADFEMPGGPQMNSDTSVCDMTRIACATSDGFNDMVSTVAVFFFAMKTSDLNDELQTYNRLPICQPKFGNHFRRYGVKWLACAGSFYVNQ